MDSLVYGPQTDILPIPIPTIYLTMKNYIMARTSWKEIGSKSSKKMIRRSIFMFLSSIFNTSIHKPNFVSKKLKLWIHQTIQKF